MAIQAADIAQQFRDKSFDSLFRWVVLIALICLGAVILWDYGFLNYLLVNDSSRISALIIGIFACFSLYCVYVIVDYSRELKTLEQVSSELEAGGALTESDGELRIGARQLPVQRLIGSFLRDAAIKRRNDPESGTDVLIQPLASQLRTPGRLGIFVADAMYKLGMLGTVIGFIAMLVSLRDMGEFDVETMRSALQQMTAGMAVALLTTITGLVSGLLLRLQFNILDGLATHILRRVVRLSELFLTRTPSA